MKDPLRRIAEDNVRYRKATNWAMAMTVIGFFPFFILSLLSDFKEIHWIILALLILVLGFGLAFHYERKIIGKKSAVDIELERLRSLHPEEKLELPELDDAELELKEMIRRNNSNDMI